MIKTYIREGKIVSIISGVGADDFGGINSEHTANLSSIQVPMEVTVALLEKAMKEIISTQGKKKFLIDGFPREMDQAIKFETEVCPSKFTLFFDCTEEVMLKRLLKRGETSGRDDDNIESIKKRFRTFVNTSMPVVDYFQTQGKVVNIDSTSSPEGVYAQVKRELAVC